MIFFLSIQPCLPLLQEGKTDEFQVLVSGHYCPWIACGIGIRQFRRYII